MSPIVKKIVPVVLWFNYYILETGSLQVATLA